MAKKDWMVKESDLEKDDWEYNVLHEILDKSCIVSGCAGSGKSVLALIKAQRIQKEKGNNYQVIVYTKTLSKYMNTGRQELGLVNIFDYHWKWQHNGCPSSDYIIVDEIQDFTKNEILEFINSTQKNFFFFGDSAQSIFNELKLPQGGTFPVNRIPNLVPPRINFKTFNLFNNYRLPIPVAKIAQYVGVNLDPFNERCYKSQERALPFILQFNDLEEQVQRIAQILKNDRSKDDVGIFVSTNPQVEAISKLLSDNGINTEIRYYKQSESGKKTLVDTLNFGTTNPKITTYHSAKGMQFETVFLPCTPNLPDGNDMRKALYVAMTRTYRNLYIMYSGSLPYPLSEIPKELYKTSEVETINDI